MVKPATRRDVVLRIGSSEEGMSPEEARRRAAELGEGGVAGLASPAAAATVRGLTASWMDTPDFRALKPRTRALYAWYVERLRDLLGDATPVAAVTRPVVLALRKRLAPQPTKAHMALTVLRLALKHGVDLGLLQANAAERFGRLPTSPRAEVWDHDAAERFLEAAPPRQRLAFTLLLYTVQRPGDVLDMAWTRIDERGGRLWIRLRQAKTDELVDVPCHARLEAALRAAPRDALLVVPSPRGLRWSYRNFARDWDRVRRRADFRLAKELFRAGLGKEEVRQRLLKGLQRRDLRRTAMVNMALAGATPAQIAAVSGHSIEQTARILETYIPRRGEVALRAIEAWENVPETAPKLAAKVPRKRG
jgi:integrase